jgi:hypothetical protein
MDIWDYFTDIWDILVHFSGLGIVHQEKSGNPGKMSPSTCGGRFTPVGAVRVGQMNSTFSKFFRHF